MDYNDVTGDRLASRVANDNYLNNSFWDNNVFARKKRGETIEEEVEELNASMTPCIDPEPELFELTQAQLEHYLMVAYGKGKIGGKLTVFEAVDMMMNVIRADFYKE